MLHTHSVYLALGTNLDTLAKTRFLDVIRGDAPRLMHDHADVGGGMSRILPFSRIPHGEILLYAGLNGIPYIPDEGQEAPGFLETESGRMLLDYTGRHPSTLFSVSNLARAIAGQGRPARRKRSSRGRWDGAGTRKSEGEAGHG